MFTGSELFDVGECAVRVHVAGSSAISQFGHIVVGVRILIFFMGAGLEVVGVAACAVRLVGAKAPRYGLRITGMAVGTYEHTAVFPGIVRGAVAKAVRGPCDGGVTAIAVKTGLKVSRVFPRGRRTIVTALAISADAVVVKGGG